MTGSRTGRLALWLGLAVALWAAALLRKGALYIDMHEGDTLHLLDMVMRMVDGQWPSIDFMTPIGALAMAPIAVLVWLGLSAGQAILAAQVMVAVILLPAVLRVAASRFPGGWGAVYGIVTLGFAVALIHGEAARMVSISMHYNRWAWALAYVALPLALLPPLGRPRPRLDGALIGLAMAGMALIKMTFFVALAVPVALALFLRGDRAALAAAVVAGLAAAAALTLVAGPGYWAAYAADLLVVAGSETREMPGDSFGQVLSGPPHLTATAAMIFAIIALRQTAAKVAGLVFLLLFPAFVYITWQNWGNDPQWLYLLAFLAIALRPERGAVIRLGRDLRDVLTVVAVVALAHGAPSAINVLTSPFHHAARPTDKMVPLVDGDPRLSDILGEVERFHRVRVQRPLDTEGTGHDGFLAGLEPEEPVLFAGEAMPDCSVEGGHSALYAAIVRDLEAAGLGGSAVFPADLLSGLWLYGDLRPLPGAAPWIYDGLPGMDNADYLLVPLCPTAPDVRARVAEAVAEADIQLTEVRRTPLYILYRPQAAKAVASR